MAPDAMASRMRQLSARFLLGLSDDLAMIASEPDAAAGIVHRLAGRAGTFGFPAISTAAGALEDIIAEHGATGPAFAAGLADLQAVVDATVTSHD